MTIQPGLDQFIKENFITHDRGCPGGNLNGCKVFVIGDIHEYIEFRKLYSELIDRITKANEHETIVLAQGKKAMETFDGKAYGQTQLISETPNFYGWDIYSDDPGIPHFLECVQLFCEYQSLYIERDKIREIFQTNLLKAPEIIKSHRNVLNGIAKEFEKQNAEREIEAAGLQQQWAYLKRIAAELGKTHKKVTEKGVAYEDSKKKISWTRYFLHMHTFQSQTRSMIKSIKTVRKGNPQATIIVLAGEAFVTKKNMHPFIKYYPILNIKNVTKYLNSIPSVVLTADL